MMNFLERSTPFIPAFGAFVWCGGLVAMLITWAAQGKPHYVSQDGSIPFISDIGADMLKPLFITISSITAACFVLSLIIERWLRHTRRLPPNMKRRERVFSCLSILGCLIGGTALILLSIFDTVDHVKAHRVLLLIFMVGVALSALFTCWEFRWLNKAHRRFPRLRGSYIAKGIIVSILLALSVAFGVTLRSNTNDVSAILEWTIGFGFTFYLITFIFDLIVIENGMTDETAHLRNGEANNQVRQQRINQRSIL